MATKSYKGRCILLEEQLRLYFSILSPTLFSLPDTVITYLSRGHNSF